MEGICGAECPTRPRSNEWTKQDCLTKRPTSKTVSFNLPILRYPAPENFSASPGLSHSWEISPPDRTLSLPAFRFRTTRSIGPRRESRKSFVSHVSKFNYQQYAPTYKYTPSSFFVPRHLISRSPLHTQPRLHPTNTFFTMNRPASLGIASNTIAPPNASEEDRIGIHPEDRWDLPFLPPLATLEGAQDISEGRFDSVFGVEGASFICSQPVPFSSCLFMGIQ